MSLSELQKYNATQKRIDFMLLVFVLLLIGALLGVLGHMSYVDEQLDRQLYCDNVRDGKWPDFRGNFDSECEESK